MNSVSFGLSTSFLVWTLSACCNAFAKSIGSSEVRVAGVTALVLVSLYTIFCYTRWWTRKTSILFYVAFFPSLVWSSFDMLTLLELYMKPSKGFLSEYVAIKDQLMHNSWMNGIIIFDAIVLNILNHVVLHLVCSGRSVRNWLLFISTYFGFMAVVWGVVVVMSGCGGQTLAMLCVPTVPILVAAPILISIKDPEVLVELNFRQVGKNSTFTLITKYLLILTLVIIFCKILIVEDYEIGFWKSHDYTLNLLEIENTKLLTQVHITLYELLMLPSILISLASLYWKWVPWFIWDLSVIQAGCLVGGQSVLIFSVLFWEMPPELRANAGDLIFWTINIIPVAASILQVCHFSPYISSSNGHKKEL